MDTPNKKKNPPPCGGFIRKEKSLGGKIVEEDGGKKTHLSHLGGEFCGKKKGLDFKSPFGGNRGVKDGKVGSEKKKGKTFSIPSRNLRTWEDIRVASVLKKESKEKLGGGAFNWHGKNKPTVHKGGFSG